MPALNKISKEAKDLYYDKVVQPATSGLAQLLHFGDKATYPFRKKRTLPRVTIKAGSGQTPSHIFLHKALEPSYARAERRLGRQLTADERNHIYNQSFDVPGLYINATNIENKEAIHPKGDTRTKAWNEIARGLFDMVDPIGDKSYATRELRHGFARLFNPPIKEHFDPQLMHDRR